MIPTPKQIKPAILMEMASNPIRNTFQACPLVMLQLPLTATTSHYGDGSMITRRVEL